MSWLYSTPSDGFLNSSFLLSLITLIAAVSVFFIYAKRRNDHIREAATVIVSEIRSVVESLPAIRDEFEKSGKRQLTEGRYLLESSRWTNYRDTLLPMLSIEEWSALKKFYENVMKYDSAIKLNDSYLDSNSQQVWVSLHKLYLKLHTEQVVDEAISNKASEASSEVIEKLKKFNEIYINDTMKYGAYSPIRPINMVKSAFENIDDNILVSTVGKKLIQLAERRPFIQWTD